MRDALAVARAWLSTIPEVSAIAGARVWAGRYLADGYKPEQGPALLIGLRGGQQDYSNQVLTPSLQLRFYGATEADASRLQRATHDAINDRRSPANHILFCRLEDGTYPTLLEEPGSKWPYYLAYYRLFIMEV